MSCASSTEMWRNWKRIDSRRRGSRAASFTTAVMKSLRSITPRFFLSCSYAAKISAKRRAGTGGEMASAALSASITFVGLFKRACAQSIVASTSNKLTLRSSAVMHCCTSADRLLMMTGAFFPRSARYCIITRRATAWNVPITGRPSRSNFARRARISVAACRVNVIANVRSISADSLRARHAMRRVRTVVFPEPAPARTTTIPTGAVTAARWSESSPASTESGVCDGCEEEGSMNRTL